MSIKIPILVYTESKKLSFEKEEEYRKEVEIRAMSIEEAVIWRVVKNNELQSKLINIIEKLKEKKIKFVRETIYKSYYISTIEESFIKGNSWIVTTFDCMKEKQIIEEKLKKKEIK